MCGCDQMGLAGDIQAFFCRDIAFRERIQFFLHDKGIENDPVAYYAFCFIGEDPGGNSMENEFLLVKNNGVPGIGSALETGNNVVAGG